MVSCSVCMRAILWHSGTRSCGQPRLSVRTMRSGGQPGLYFSGGSSSIPDETSSGFCSSGQNLISFGGSTYDVDGVFLRSVAFFVGVIVRILVGGGMRYSAAFFWLRDGLGRLVQGSLRSLAAAPARCALRAARSLRVDGAVSPIRAVSFVRVAPSRNKQSMARRATSSMSCPPGRRTEVRKDCVPTSSYPR
jgi:hypothetical protein